MRPNIDEYFLKIACVVAERSTCQRHYVGAVAVRSKHILSTGYNGAGAGLRDCLELGCLRNELNIPSGTRHEICRAIHAEQNAIIGAARAGVSILGGTMYLYFAKRSPDGDKLVNALPCFWCKKTNIFFKKAW